MEAKPKLTNGFKNHKNISSSEKKCNKCGFATFSLRVLYTHQHKCQGTNLDVMTCCHCKRKFSRLLLFRQHKKTCLKSMQNKKTSKKVFIRNKLKALGVTKETKDKNAQDKKAPTSFASTIACPTCMKLFSSQSEYDAHAPKGSCSAKSARKSFSTSTPKGPVPSVSRKEPSASGSETKNEMKSFQVSDDDLEISDGEIGVACKWCKNVYPNHQILAKHLERNSRCALAHREPNHPEKKPVEERSARKSLPSRNSQSSNKSRHDKCARKSFPNRQRNIAARFVDTRSARKSLPGSSRNRYAVDPSPLKSLNQCPVCYQKIPDPYKFYQHQKKLNHFGRATKSMNNVCKCPFCYKQFLHVRSLHAHVRSHANKSDQEIEFFLKKTTCAICAQVFGSERAKYQHMRYFHSKSASDSSPKSLDSSSYSLLPLAVKQKLRLHPNTCPICSKEFPATYFRNKHFQENHLDGELECKFCPEKFNTVESMDNHMHDSHYNDFQFECLICKINLATASNVVLHCTKVHSSQDPNKIIRKRDDKSLVQAPGFELPAQEAEEDGSNGFYCDICDLRFLKKAGLLSHRLSKLHKDTVVKNLDNMRQSIADLPSPKRAPKVMMQTPEILTCSECLEDFSSVKDFVPHRLSHFGRGKYMRISDSNRYICEICGEVSNSHSKVQMHLFWHLQVESTTTEKTSAKDKGKTDPIVPDRLSGQTVAKKSFAKSQQQEIVIGGIKKSLFTCENCNIGFTTQAHYSVHVRKLCKKKTSVEKPKAQNVANNAGSSKAGTSNAKSLSLDDDDSLSSEEEFKSTILCTTCNCLFLSSLVKDNHENFCKNSSYHDFDAESSKEILKPFNQLKGVIAVCIGCSVVFNDIRALKKHVLQHNSKKGDKKKPSSVNGPSSVSEDEPLTQDSLGETSAVKSLEASSSEPQESLDQESMVAEDSDESFSILRTNFSQLFCILINDSELMQTLGFGELPVDDVLINVLQQMGQSPVAKESDDSDLERFRKNIRIFLDFCLKDQVMEMIESGTTSVDDIVVEALKTFTSEEVTAHREETE